MHSLDTGSLVSSSVILVIRENLGTLESRVRTELVMFWCSKVNLRVFSCEMQDFIYLHYFVKFYPFCRNALASSFPDFLVVLLKMISHAPQRNAERKESPL